MVIVGYQGIGKSTLAMLGVGCIDLESSNFFINSKRDDNWYIVYCNIAEHLSKQGYDVFVSSHEVVRKELAKREGLQRMIVCPSIELKDVWIEKLYLRYEKDLSDKNYKAYMNALDRYEDNIKELLSEKGFEIKVINDMLYNLSTVLWGEQNRKGR